MVLLVAQLGLRIGDTRNLKPHDIDWTKKQTSITRYKTQKALLLPLPEEVSWAIIDYLKNGRPITESPSVFVRHRSPYDAFSVTSSLNHMFSSVIVNAGLPPEEDTDVGWHTFRRFLAANLLQNNVGINMISEILGYSTPDAAGKCYVQLDLEDLKKCTLEVEAVDYARKGS